MIRFLGEVGSCRKKRKARRCTNKGKKNDDHSREKSNRPWRAQKMSNSCCKPSKESDCNLQMENLHQFFDSMSIETSLYTTPSKPTIQYPRGTRASENIDWHSSQGSEDLGPGTEFTAEFALAQYRLGGWQSPPIIEKSLTPSTESSTSSLSSLPKSYDDNLEVCSTCSSEISWNFDSLKFYEEEASSKAINNQNEMTIGSGENMATYDKDGREKHVRRNTRSDEDSACSSVSSMSTGRFCDDSCKSIISSWSSSSSPTSFSYDHSPLKSDRMSSSHGSYESPITNRSTSQGTGFSRKNDSISSNDSILTPVTFNADEKLSFSELLSRCENESLAERLAPCNVGQIIELFGRTDTSLDMPKPKIESIENSYSRMKMGCISPSRKKHLNIVTPKISNMSTSLSDYNHMIPKASNTNSVVEIEAQTTNYLSIANGSSNDFMDSPGTSLSDYNEKSPKAINTDIVVEVESQITNDVSITNGPSNDCIDFPRMLSKFEEISLQYDMEPPLPRRLTGQKFEIITDVDEGKETLNCSNHKLHQYKYMQNTDDVATSQQKNEKLLNATTLSSSSQCKEEISSLLISTGLNGTRKSACSSGTLEESNELLLEANFLTRDQCPYNGPVDLDELTANELQPNINVQNSKSIATLNPQKSVHRDTTTESDVLTHNQYPYDGPVDLDELLMNGLSLSPETLSKNDNESIFLTPRKVYQSPDYEKHRPRTSPTVFWTLDKDDHTPSISCGSEEENMSKIQPQRDHDLSFVNKEVKDQSDDEVIISNGTSKRDQGPREIYSPGSLLLREDDLIRHNKSMQRQNPVPSVMISGYNHWKRDQEVERLYFEELQQKVMEKKSNPGRLETPSKGLHRLLPQSCNSGTADILDNTKSIMNENKYSAGSKIQTRKRNRKAWKFLRILRKNDDDSTGVKNEKGEKKKRHNKTEKVNKKLEKSTVIDIDKLMSISNDYNILDSDAFAELSLFPLSQLEHLTKNNAHNFLRKKVWEHLEVERQRQRLAEIDQEEDERREQIIISPLKEQELARQRHLRSPGFSHCIPNRVASPGLPFLNNQTSFDHQQTVTQPGSEFDCVINSHKFHQNEKTRITYSTSRVSESLRTCSVGSFPHTQKSFDSIKTTLSLDAPNNVSPLPLCAVCKVKERTHISMPCMHYSFCSDCAEELHGLETPICPICQTEDIILSRVYL